MNSVIQDGWTRNVVTYWRHSDIPGWVVRVGRGPLVMKTPEGETVTDNEGKPWRFKTLDDAYEFAKRALDPEGA